MEGSQQTVEAALWCDGFDADLLAVVPQIEETIGDLAGVSFWTYSHATNGKINCPSAWWTNHGLTSFFATKGYGGPAPAGYWTDKPIVECTFIEILRDEWLHDAVVVINGHFVWKPPSVLQDRLMADVRGWNVLSDDERETIRENVRRSIAAACERLSSVLASLREAHG